MANEINIGGRLHSVASGNVVAGANEIYDDEKKKRQSDINVELENAIEAAKVKSASAEIPENDSVGTPTAHATLQQDGNIHFEFEHLKGEKGEQGVQGEPGPRGESIVPIEGEVPVAHDLGNNSNKLMSQVGVTTAVMPLKSFINGKQDITNFPTTGKVMHLNPHSNKDLTGGQISEFVRVSKGDVIIVNTKTAPFDFTAIAFFTGNTTADHDTWKSGENKVNCESSEDSDLHTYTLTMPADGYGRVSGVADGMTAHVQLLKAAAEKKDIETMQAEIETQIEESIGGVQNDIEGLQQNMEEMQDSIGGTKSFTEWTAGALHPNSGQPVSPSKTPAYADFKYSELMTLNKGDVVTVRSYYNGTNCKVIAVFDGATHMSEEGASTYYKTENDYFTVSVTIEEDGRTVRVSGMDDGVHDAVTAEVTLASGFARKVELKAMTKKIEEVEAQISDLGDGDGTLPEYWKSYLENRMPDLDEEVATAADAFIFVTDTHYMENIGLSSSVIEAIVKNHPFAKVFHGGDVCSTGWANTYIKNAKNYEQMCIREIKAFDELARKVSLYARFYAVRGNHDFHEYNGGSKYRHSAAEDVAHIAKITDDMGRHDNVKSDPEGIYYYVDNKEDGVEIRYFFLDSFHASAGGYLQLGLTQLNWLVDALNSTPEDYKIVIITHAPINGKFFASGKETYNDNYAYLRTIIREYNGRNDGSINYSRNNGTTTETGTVAYDFRSADAQIIAIINGHVHSDNQAYYDGIPFVSVICDKHNHHNFSPFCEDTDLDTTSKTKGTSKEQALEAVTINATKDIISFHRIGLGFDRHFHIGEISIEAGETQTLSAEKITADKWTACDEDIHTPACLLSNNQTAVDSDYDWPYDDNVATISDGVVSALEPGDAIVFAEDENHNKEFWHVKVIATQD